MKELEFKILLNQRLCDLVDLILHYYDPCKIEDGKCLLCDDMATDRLHCCMDTKYNRSLDNRRCIFWSDKGCTVRIISCKIWLCATAIGENIECTDVLREVEAIAKRYGLMQRPFLGDRYVGRTEEWHRMLKRDQEGQK